MQKFDFVKALKDIVDQLQSQNIVDFYNSAMKKDVNGYYKNAKFKNLLPILFQSKGNYVNLQRNKNYENILTKISADDIYSNDNLSLLAVSLSNDKTLEILKIKECVELYCFHKSLLMMLHSSESLLLSESLNDSFENSIENGILIFQTVIENNFLNSEDYIKIFTALQELTNIVGKIIYGKETEKYNTEIILLDSGSDTNIGIKTKAEIAKAIFDLFKEIWDYITSFKFNRQDRKNKELLDSLAIRSEIKKKVEEGVISPEEAKEYEFYIKK
jgi:hypothetical protein|nr:MAG TPA: hypothetical protein [Caudoviricetes sp.]